MYSLFLSLGLAPHCFVEIPSRLALDVSVLARDAFMVCLTILQSLLFLHGSRRCHRHGGTNTCPQSRTVASVMGRFGTRGGSEQCPAVAVGAGHLLWAEGVLGALGTAGTPPPWGPRWQPSAFGLTLLGPSGQKSTLGRPRRSGEGDESTAFLPALERRSVLLPR